jgi:hypothetical protein
MSAMMTSSNSMKFLMSLIPPSHMVHGRAALH